MKLYPDIKIILCMGNLSENQYRQLKNAGAKRYILKFETSNPELHKFCRPSDNINNRLEKIQTLITATDKAYFPAQSFGKIFYVKRGEVTT